MLRSQLLLNAKRGKLTAVYCRNAPRELSQDDLEIIKTIVNPEKIETVWTGEDITTDIAMYIAIPGKLDIDESVNLLKNRLVDKL